VVALGLGDTGDNRDERIRERDKKVIL